MSKKAVIIGLDGISYDLVGKWIEENEIKSFRYLKDNGISGVLNSVVPPMTVPAFASIMTGYRPENTGIFDYFRINSNYEVKLNSFSNLKKPPFWGYLNRNNKTVGVLNLPFTYPVAPVNGFIVSGFLTPHNVENYAYPEGLLDEIKAYIGDYCLHLDEKYIKNNPSKFIEEQYKANENLTETALYLLKNKKWDIFFMHYSTPDRVQHEIWHFEDKKHPQHDIKEVAQFGNLLKDFFIHLDKCIYKIIREVEKDALVILFSDHGFGGIDKFINVNTLLLNNGIIKLKNNVFTKMKFSINKLGINYMSIGKILLKLGLAKYIMSKDFTGRQSFQEKVFLSLKDVEWKETEAFSMGNVGQIYINTKKRFKQGKIDTKEEYNAVVNKVKKILSELKDPDTNESLVEKIYTKEELYNGDFYDAAPDIVFDCGKKRYKALGLADFPSMKIIEDVYGCTGNHKNEGIIMFKANDIKKEDKELKKSYIYDIVPTVLKYCGIKTKNNFDGDVIKYADGSDIF